MAASVLYSNSVCVPTLKSLLGLSNLIFKKVKLFGIESIINREMYHGYNAINQSDYQKEDRGLLWCFLIILKIRMICG